MLEKDILPTDGKLISNSTMSESEFMLGTLKQELEHIMLTEKDMFTLLEEETEELCTI